MINIPFDKFYADNLGLIHTVARKGYNRMYAIGAGIDYEDLVQELSVTFIRAFNGMKDDRAKFATYFTRSALNRINALAEDFEVERLGIKTTRNKILGVQVEVGVKPKDKWVKEVTQVHSGCSSVEEMSDWNSDGEESSSPLSLIASDCGTPEQNVEAADTYQALMTSLSPLAAELTRMTIDPPDFIEREFEAQEAHAEFARGLGKPRRCRGSLNLSFVCSVIGKTTDLSDAMIKSARGEVILALKGSV
jgi:DNA-directed RNA polymerase specialized sigma24 family protein